MPRSPKKHQNNIYIYSTNPQDDRNVMKSKIQSQNSDYLRNHVYKSIFLRVPKSFPILTPRPDTAERIAQWRWSTRSVLQISAPSPPQSVAIACREHLEPKTMGRSSTNAGLLPIVFGYFGHKTNWVF